MRNPVWSCDGTLLFEDGVPREVVLCTFEYTGRRLKLCNRWRRKLREREECQRRSLFLKEPRTLCTANRLKSYLWKIPYSMSNSYSPLAISTERRASSARGAGSIAPLKFEHHLPQSSESKNPFKAVQISTAFCAYTLSYAPSKRGHQGRLRSRQSASAGRSRGTLEEPDT